MAQAIHLKLKSNITIIKLIDIIKKKYRINKIKSEKRVKEAISPQSNNLLVLPPGQAITLVLRSLLMVPTPL